MIRRRRAGQALIAIGLLGVLAGLGGIVLGQMLVSSAEDALSRSLVLSGEAIEALEDAVAVVEETVRLAEGGLRDAETTTEDIGGTVADGAILLRGTADLTEQRLADSLAAFEASLPGLIDVTSVVDRTLRGLSSLPFGPSYDPPEAFDDSLRQLQASLEGVPADLRRQAVLLRATGDQLEEIGTGTEDIARDIGSIRAGLGEGLGVLERSTATAASAREAVADTQSGLDRQLTLARVLVVLLGIATAAGQVVPLGLGWTLLRPEGARPLLREEAPEAEPVVP